MAFTAAARHEPVPGGDQPPEPDAARLDPAFRESIPAALTALADAWEDPAAWTGTTKVGGVDLPRQVAGLVVLDEVVVHGWDLAAALDRPYEPPPDAVEGALGFVGPTVTESPGGTPGSSGHRLRSRRTHRRSTGSWGSPAGTRTGVRGGEQRRPGEVPFRHRLAWGADVGLGSLVGSARRVGGAVGQAGAVAETVAASVAVGLATPPGRLGERCRLLGRASGQ